ncbi:hypothetical protein BGW39_001619 [Mortierella sp. 14UC]|nr:hypothetical protein BGW39_001619 [Mortierella sp. 14UC]
MTGITDLPQELISMVADYLNRKDRTRFAGTCRNHYQALITHLWKQVHVESDFPHYGFTNVPITPVKPFIASSRLEQYATHVNLLGLHGPFHSDHYAIKSPSLHTLMLQYDSEFHAPSNRQEYPDTLDGTLDTAMLAETHVNNANLIRLNPIIKDIFRYSCAESIPSLRRLLGRHRYNTPQPDPTLSKSNKSSKSNEQAFEALSRLMNLEYMDFALKYTSVSDIDKHLPKEYRYMCLQWRLDSGLERLSTLKKVRNLGFASTEQEMMEEDLEWMLDNWPLLEEVKGEFSGDAGYHNVLVDMLKERHIAHF